LNFLDNFNKYVYTKTKERTEKEKPAKTKLCNSVVLNGGGNEELNADGVKSIKLLIIR
jgi:hypothetical protein